MNVVTATAHAQAALSTVQHFNSLDALGYTANVDGQDATAVRPLVALTTAVLAFSAQGGPREINVEMINPEAQTVEFTLTLDMDEDRIIRISE